MTATINNISLYIPHVFANFTQQYVADVFAEFGEVSTVDFVSKLDRSDKEFNAAYIHFKRWYNTADNVKFQQLVTNPDKEARVYHDEPWYWVVLPNIAKKHISGDRKPRIDLGNNIKTISANVPAPVPPVKLPIAPTLFCPTAPSKPVSSNFTYASAVAKSSPLDEYDFEASEELAQMEELEAIMAEEDSHLISIDSRYIAQMEEDFSQMAILNERANAEIARAHTEIETLRGMLMAFARKEPEVTARNEPDVTSPHKSIEKTF